MSARHPFMHEQDDRYRQFDELGVAQVRALLRAETVVPNAGWRREAQLWLDERLRREGEWAYALVLASIGLLGLAIGVLAWLSW